MDYDKNDCPILPPLSDIIKAYSKAKAKQATYAPITRTDFERDRFNFDPDGFQPENPGPLPLAAVPSLIQILQQLIQALFPPTISFHK